MSAFPLLFYNLGYNEEAYRFISTLPTTNRSEYPEVSYGIVEGIVCGAMGLSASASDGKVTSLSRIADDFCDIKNVPVFNGYISLRHEGMNLSEISNDTDTDLIWVASFQGKHDTLECDGQNLTATVSTDVKGNTISSAEIKLPKGAKKTVRTVN